MIGGVLLMVAGAAGASYPDPPEMAEARRWAEAKFGGVQEAAPQPTGLVVYANHGVVQPNARGERPMRIGEREYTRGLYCHANSRVLVRLERPAERFTALAGVDTNDQTSGGRGSVVFVVRVGEREAFRTDVRREGMPPVAVSVDLGGATEFAIAVEDAGDGIACDQADWVEAKVEFPDGESLWLGDLALHEPPRHPYTTEPPFSFHYGGRASSEFLSTWEQRRSDHALDGQRTERTVTYRDPATGLCVRMAGVEYRDLPVVEWTLHFANEGPADTPVVSGIQAVDTRFERTAPSEFVLHRIRGDDCTPESYQPLTDTLGPSADLTIANTGGRPTQLAFPYLNLEWAGEGVMCALGWPGQWAMRLTRDGGNGLVVRGGQELTHFVLHPGEDVRAPLVVLLFYQGDWLRGQNLWRRWMVAHNMPRPGGQLPPTLRSLCNGNYYPELMTVGEQERGFIEKFLAEGIGFDLWWQDAGWYPCDGVGWPKVGTWEADPVRFPRGLRELSDLTRAHGKKTIVWFEPERVHSGTWIAEQHPEWVHGGAGGGLLKLDDPACRAWLTDHIDGLLAEQGIDFYRQDFNIDPLPYWRANDAEDRQGITEIRHVEGYLAYWDELRRRHPDMLIDSCASGGRRNDLETLRRAVPLLRSDWYWSPEGQQCLTYGLSLWLPYQGTGFILPKDEYWMRSSMVAEMSFGPDAKGLGEVDFDQLRRLVDEHRLISPFFLGDYYPLTPYTHATDAWMAWQFHRPDLDAGVVQAFRRPDSPYETARFRLSGLNPAVRYRFRNVDGQRGTTMTGREAMETGLAVTIADRPAAAAIIYERMAGRATRPSEGR
jgi:alpha-galactosidase